jgi:endonuclease/exonuclease/phosphatase (EEP) superfamily protein YafD
MELVRAIAFAIAGVSALAAIASLGGAVNQEFDLFAHLAPLWSAAALVAVIAHLLAGGRLGAGATLLATAALVVGIGLIGPELWRRATMTHAAPAAQTLKIIQFNVWDHNRDPAATTRWILSQDADIVVLEETGRGEIPAALAARYPYRTHGDTGENVNTTILSKRPQSDGGVLRWPHLGPRHVGAWATFDTDGERFAVVGTHYRWPPPLARRSSQPENFAEALAPFDHRNLIVVGDFNLTPWSFALRRQDARFGLARLTHGIATFPAGKIAHFGLTFPFPLLAIDQVYAGEAWRAVSIARGQAAGSDHYPIVAVLTRDRPAS